MNGDGRPDCVYPWGSSPAGYGVMPNTSVAVGSCGVNAPPTAVAGVGFGVTVTAKGPSGATLTGYRGTVHFTSTDPLVSAGSGLPADYTFTAGDNGQHTFPGVALRTAGSITVTVRDAAVTAAAGTDTVSVSAAAAAAIVTTSGGGQSAAVAAAFGGQLVAKVTDAFGNPIPGKTVTFAGPGSGAGVTFPAGATAVTNAGGQAAVSVQANTAAGAYTVTAATAGVGTPASFDLTNTAGAPAAVAAVSGGGQSAPVGTTFGSPLVAVVTDGFGNPVPGATVTFTGPGSGAGVIFPSGATATTGATGQASVTVRANAVTGPYSVTTTVAGVAGSAAFGLTNVAGAPAAIVATSGGGQTATVNTAFAGQLVAKVLDAVGNPVAGVTVTFAGPAGGAGVTFPAGTTAVTDAAGLAGVAVAANTTAGSFTVTATTAGVAGGAAFGLTNAAGAPASLAVVTGANQTATVNTTFAAQLITRVLDAFGNPVVGASVAYSGPGTGAGVSFPTGAAAATGAGGQAGVIVRANTAAGAYSVTATATGVGTPASFALTNTPGAGTISVAAGTAQSAAIGTAFAAQLVAKVLDGFGNPVPGVTVTFAGPAGGAGVTFPSGATATTDAAGQAAVAVAANTAAGGYQVTAAAPGVGGQAAFTLGNTPGPAVAVAAESGAGQTVVVNAGFLGLLVARVTDAFGNGVSGVAVTFAGPAGGAGVTFPVGATAITDPAGRASATVSANPAAGAYAVTATVAGIATPASFALTNTAGAAAAIAVAAGGGQSATVGTGYSGQLVAKVIDAFGNPVSGVVAAFAGPTADATVSFPGGTTATTDAAGLAGVAVAANTVTGPLSVTAAAAGVVGSAGFTLTVAPGAPVSVVASDTRVQSAPVGGVFLFPLHLRVSDAFNNPVPGVAVTFAGPTTGAGPTFPNGAVLTTNRGGFVLFTVGANTVPGSYAVTATVAGVAAPASFPLANTAGAAAHLDVVSGTGQSAAVGTAFGSPLVARVTDAFGNPVAGAVVTFAGPATGAGVTFPAGAAATTGADGVAAVPVAANTTAGPVTVAATAGAAAASFALVNAAGAAAGVTVGSGDGQSAAAGGAFPAPLVVRVTDAFGNGVPGVTVTFAGSGVTFPGGATATTGADGAAAVPVAATSVAGPVTVLASVAGVGGSAAFHVTAAAGAPAGVAVAGGDGQSAAVGAAFPVPLVARLTDTLGNPIPGAAVTFAGAGVTFPSGATATTDADGRAGVVAVASGPAGSVAVTATAAGVASPAAFALTATAAVARVAPLAVSGRADGSAAVYTPDASGRYPTTASAVLRPFPGFGGDVRVATGDFNGDGVADTVLVTGPGTKTVMAIVSGKDGSTLLPATDPFGDANFTFGGFVAAGDIDGDGRAEWVVTPELRGGPRVIIFRLLADGTFDVTSPGQPSLVANFFGIGDPAFRDGDRPALGDVNGDGVLDVFSIAAFNGGPRTALYNGADVLVARAEGRDPAKLTGDFFATVTGTGDGRGGRSIASGDVNGDGKADLIVTGDNLLGTGNQVTVFSGADLAAGRVPGFGATVLANFAASGQNPSALSSVAATNADGDTRADVAVGSGAGQPSLVKLYLGKDVSGAAEPASEALDPFGGPTLGGVFVG